MLQVYVAPGLTHVSPNFEAYYSPKTLHLTIYDRAATMPSVYHKIHLTTSHRTPRILSAYYEERT
jgi:hypothetical protein